MAEERPNGAKPTAQKSVADFMVERLAYWGVRRVFAYSGDGINGLLSALHRSSERIDYVASRHEEMSAFMACGYAKFSGQVGVCLATSGPGAVHLLNGLYDAKRDHQPVVAIVGQAPSTALGADFLQEVDLHALFKDVAAEYVQELTEPAQARHLVDRALRIALTERTVTLPHRAERRPGAAGRGITASGDGHDALGSRVWTPAHPAG
jgi:pyruvate dehydrogenase (quinone)